jgi:ribosomal protein L11 methyltransferase
LAGQDASPQTMTQSWKITLPCTRAEAEALTDDMGLLADMPVPPVLMTSELEEDNPLIWQVEAFFEGKPDKRAIALLSDLVPSSKNTKAVIEKLPDADWLTMSQRDLEPVIAGRFHIRNREDDPVPAGYRSFLIGAGRAFGTGQHETTSGCLNMIDRCRSIGSRFGNIADVGTGTGVLAFAAMHLWPRAYATASDIDPASVEVTIANAHINAIPLGRSAGRLSVYQAAGVAHEAIAARAPYDLLIANILAGPLIELAPSLCALVEEGGTIILAGLLDTQAERVITAYARQGMRLADRIDNGQWPTLRLRKRPKIGFARPRRWKADDVGEAPGFGSW